MVHSTPYKCEGYYPAKHKPYAIGLHCVCHTVELVSVPRLMQPLPLSTGSGPVCWGSSGVAHTTSCISEGRGRRPLGPTSTP